MSGLLKPPTFRCDETAETNKDSPPEQPEGQEPASAVPERAPASVPDPIPDPEPADREWSLLVVAAKASGIPIVRLAPDQAVALAGRGIAEVTLRRLLHGYPAAPLVAGTLTFFPPLADLLNMRRIPELFYVAEAWKGEHVFKRRLRASLDDLETAESDTEESNLDAVLLDSATDYLESIGTRTASAQDGRYHFWLPGAAESLTKEAGEAGADVAMALCGPLMAWEDFHAELERRTMVARLWALLGLALCVGVLTQSMALSSRLLLAFAALGLVGGGLGVGPWMRANARLRELVAARLD